jgi:regulator of protease activity HflC (stomatin/prohibitin superfamily)
MAFQGSRQSGPGWPPRRDWEDLRAQFPELPQLSPRVWGSLAVAVLVLWAATGIYIVEPGEQGVVLQFGRVIKTSVILAKAYEGSQRARGQGDAMATRIYGAEFGKDAELYGFVRSLEAYEKFLGEKSTVLLSPNSRLLRYLTDAKTGK